MSLRTSHRVPAPVETVWEWHTHPGAVSRLTPPFLPMRPIQEAASLRDGTTVFSLPGGMRWVAQHNPAGFEDRRRFEDVTVNPPLSQLTDWRHSHTFSPDSEGTRITDEVETRIPGRLLKSAFAYRQHQLNEDLAFLSRLDQAYPKQKSLTVAFTGATGTVGRALSAQLSTAGHSVIGLTRSTEARPGFRTWDPDSPAPDLLDGVDVLVHLAGEPLFGRFTDRHQADIYASRVGPTRHLAELVAKSESVTAMVTASAIGFYGADRGSENLTEESPRGEGFLADVVADWEHATHPASSAGTRVAHVRTGITLSTNGGMLPILAALVSTGLGGPIADGSNWLSWIALDDLVDVYVHAILDETLSGAVNATAPNPATNRELTKAIGTQLHRPTFIPVPAAAPGVLLGREGARELALASQLVDARVLAERGHHFRYPQLADALAHELGREELMG